MSRRRQPHRIAPPISHGPEMLDSEIVLHELPDDVGLLLWKTVRSLRLWSDAAADQRAELFADDAHNLRLRRLQQLDFDADLQESMETAAAILNGPYVPLEAVVTSARLIASWAAQHGHTGTALEFTQAAAFLSPKDAELILSVATYARAHGELARAESWYRQAIVIARRTQDWISLANAYLGIGRTLLERGNYATARVMLIRGVRAATRHSLWEERAQIAHQIARLAARTDRPAEVVRSARIALEAYDSGDPRLHQLSLELGIYWVRSGYTRDARRLLLALNRDILTRDERLERAAALSRAHAALQDVAGFEATWADADLILSDIAPSRHPVPVLTDLVHAAAEAEHSDRLHSAVDRLIRVAELRGDPKLRATAEQLARAARGEEPFPAAPARRRVREVHSLVDALVAALAQRAEAA